jgi:hypothetical protein
MRNKISKAAASRISKKVSMSLEEFTDEHKHLLKVLRHGSRQKRQSEAKRQAKEMEKY